MHRARPYGLHVVGKPLTDKDEAFISNAAARLTNLKQASKVKSLKMVYDLPDGGYVIIQDTGGNFRVIAHKPIQAVQRSTDGLAKQYIPMLYSGAVTGSALLNPNQGLPLTLTLQTRKRLLGYGENIAPRKLRLQRFACPYAPMFREFAPNVFQQPNSPIHTQYIHQRPTWYSGAMSEVMQIVGGYGKQLMDQLPDDPMERAQIQIPESYRAQIANQIDKIRLPAYSGLPNKDGQFQYNYKFNQTHLVGFDDLKQPWLLKVDATGVWAMPLPIIPATKTSAFHEFIQQVGDDEIAKILDRFGAMPSGEAFPTGDDFQSWYRAGVIVKVCDTGDFYNHSAYGTTIGWSSNLDGSELVNTCFNYDRSAKLFQGMAYKIRLELNSADNQGWVKDLTDDREIADYKRAIYQLLIENTARNVAIKYKVSRASPDTLRSRLKLRIDYNEVIFWDNLMLPPIAAHKGNIRKISQGYLYNSNIIKVPEPLLLGCVSLGFTYNTAPDEKIKTDTIVLAYFIGNELKTVNFFSDKRPLVSFTKNDYESCMIVGKWSQYSRNGSGGIQGSVYLTDVDDREPIHLSEEETLIEGKDLGYAQPSFRFAAYFDRQALLWRTRYYSLNTNIVRNNGPSLSVACVMPFYGRNAIVYAKRRTSSSVFQSDRMQRKSVTDPNQYVVWTYHFSWAWAGQYVGKGRPFPKDGRPVYADQYHYRPTECSDFADEGPWLPTLPVDVADIMYGASNIIWAFEKVSPPPPLNEYYKEDRLGGEKTYQIKCSIFSKIELVSNQTNPSNWYYINSPTPDGRVFEIDMCKVVIGDIDYANISEVTDAGRRKQWGKTDLVDNKSAHHFIGVINE